MPKPCAKKINRAPDQQYRDLIVTRLDVNMMVEAAAGSGKTHNLASRMAAGIVSGKYRVEEMAAVTFTRKAAAELRGRFQLLLEQKLHPQDLQDSLDREEQQRVSAALAHLEHLFAGTIHSFCARLLAERPVEAGLAPGFEQLDEVQDEQFRRQTWRDYLSRERARGTLELRQLEEAGVEPADLEDALYRVSLFDEVAFPPGNGQLPPSGPAWQAIDDFWRQLLPLLPDSLPLDSTCPVQKHARRFRGLYRVADRKSGSVLAELLSCWETAPKFTLKWWASDRATQHEVCDQVSDLITQFQTVAVNPWLEAWRQYVYRLAMTVLVGAREFARDARRRALKLNYGDLLQHSAKLLREDTQVRQALQEKFRWLFVDEFQDTDPIQAEVILLLGRDESTEHGKGPVDWTTAKLRPGALFIVGDPKQSIYRFRRADMETYNNVKEIIRTNGGEIVPLTASFRSLPNICKWVDRVFLKQLPDKDAPEQPAFQTLSPVRLARDAGSNETGIRTLTVPANVPKEEIATRNADAIARYIFSEVDAGRRRWQDFLILTRQRKNLHLYAAALEGLRIPVEVSGAGAFGKSSEVEQLAVLLGSLSDPDDSVALVGVLRGRLFGLSDQELFRYRRSGRSFVLTAPLPDDGTVPSEIARAVSALRSLQQMYRWTRTLPAPVAVERVLEASGLLAYAAALSPGGAEAGDLLHAVDRVRRAAEDGGGIADAVAQLYVDMESAEVESVPVEPGRRAVVRLMNLHRAKGLEAPVVFLADPCVGTGGHVDIRIVRSSAGAVGFMPITRANGQWARKVVASPTNWAQHEAEEQRFIDAEEVRLRYVAATRACDLLVISRATGGGTQPWKSFDADLTKEPELEVPDRVEVPALEAADLSPRKRQADAGSRIDRKKCLEPTWSTCSVTSSPSTLTTSNTSDRRSADEETTAAVSANADAGGIDGSPSPMVAALDQRMRAAGLEWGTLIHALLESAMRQPNVTMVQIERLANWLAFTNPELQQFIPEAVETVIKVMASEAWQRAASSEERHVEVPFAICKEKPGEGRMVLQGVIDLVYRTSEGWEILDYKTDQPTEFPDEILSRHEDQLETYRQSWSTITRENILRAGIYPTRWGTVQWLKQS